MSGFKLNTELLARLGGRISYLNARNNVLSNNLSNLETPEFKAQELEFDGYVEEALGGADKDLKSVYTPKMEQVDAPGEAKPNGNTVNLEEQMADLADNSLEFMMATEVLKKQLSLIKLSMAN